jgi:YVTN family beta-propeller protein
MKNRCFSVLSALALAVSFGAAGAASADTLVVGNKAEATASILDVASRRVIMTLPTSPGPHELAVSPNGRLALVAGYGAAEDGSTLTLIDLPSVAVVKTIDLGQYRRPHGLLWLDNRRALVTSEASKNLLEVDVEDGKVVRALATGQETSHMVAVTPDGSRAFVANIKSGSMTAFDLKAGKKLGDVKTGKGAEGIAVTPDGREVWVTNREKNTVSVIDAKTLKVLATLKSPEFPIRVKATTDGKHMLVSNAKSGDLAVFSVADRKLERRIRFDSKTVDNPDQRLLKDFGTSPAPVGILIAPNGKTAYVALTNADQIAIVDLTEWKVTGFLKAGKEPDGMGYSILDAGMGVRPLR